MKIDVVPCSVDNYSYLLFCKTSQKAAVVDPTEAQSLLKKLEAEKYSLTAIFCTHHHHDHTGDIDALLRVFPEAEVVCHRTDVGRIKAATTPVEDGDEVGFGEQFGKVLHTPGHTHGSICYLFGDALFVGDTLFGAGCGRLFEGDAAQMYSSLMDKIAPLPEATMLYFGHEYTRKNLEFATLVESDNPEIEKRRGELELAGGVSTPTTISLEKKTNPFLRTAAPGVKNTAVSKGAFADDPVSVFAAIRQMRNQF